MKLKYYLRGLGIGILVSTIILMIAFSGHKSDISDKEIILRAQALGMVMADQKKTDAIPKGTESLSTEGTEHSSKAKSSNQPQTEKSSQASTQKKPEASSQASGTTPSTTSTPAPSTTPTTPTVPAVPPTAPATPPADTAPISITVAPGESSNAVADKLFAASLIDDAGAFNKYLVEHKYDSSIQPGSFSIPKGATYEEISKALTGK